jgi:Holliday junction DNA helicase RuvA
MIGYLEGPIHSLQPDRLIVLAGGVGYLVHIPLSTYYRLEGEQTAKLLVHTHVREDVIALYGFFTANEKLAFEKLIAISGIGPRLAQVILSGIDVTNLAAAITQGDVRRLSAIPGVGKKTAERMCLELRDKLVIIDTTGARTQAKPLTSVDDDAVSALVNLGYKASIAEDAVRKAHEDLGEGEHDFSTLLRTALAKLAK